MIVTCPSCSSKYSVRTDVIGNGKIVRCAICGATWSQSVEKQKKIDHLENIMKWTFFLFVVFIAIFPLCFAKNSVAKIWPQMSSFYEAIGVQSKNEKNSFIIKNVSNFFLKKNGKLYIGLRGELTNISKKVQLVPSIIITLKNSPEIMSEKFYSKSWTHDINYKKILPEQKVLFETEMQSVPSSNLICDIILKTL